MLDIRRACLLLFGSVSRPVRLVAASQKVRTPRLRRIRRAKSRGVAQTVATPVHLCVPEVVTASAQGRRGPSNGGTRRSDATSPQLGGSRRKNLLPSARGKNLDAPAHPRGSTPRARAAAGRADRPVREALF